MRVFIGKPVTNRMHVKYVNILKNSIVNFASYAMTDAQTLKKRSVLANSNRPMSVMVADNYVVVPSQNHITVLLMHILFSSKELQKQAAELSPVK